MIKKIIPALFIIVGLLLLLFVLILSNASHANPDATPDITMEQPEPEPEPTKTAPVKPKPTLPPIIEEPKEEPKEPIEITMYFTEKDVIALAKVLYNECRGIPSDVEKACVGWTACNRVDAGYGDTIYEVLTAPHQFAYWHNTPVIDELYNLALDVLTRWNNEKNGIENVGRVLPPEYLWFHGDGEHNHFRNKFNGDFDVWDYSLNNPYNS